MHQSGGKQLVITLRTETAKQQASGDTQRERRQRDRTRHAHLMPVPDWVLITSHHETPVHINSITIKRMGSGPEGKGSELVFVLNTPCLVLFPHRL